MMRGHPERRAGHRRALSRGFSLVEILVAFTILTLFVATTFQVFSTGVRSTTLAGEYARAHTLARSRLDELAASSVLAPGRQSGQVAMDGGARTLHWRTTVTEYALPGEETGASESRPAPLLAVVEVTWGGEGVVTAPRRFELRALLLGNKGGSHKGDSNG